MGGKENGSSQHDFSGFRIIWKSGDQTGKKSGTPFPYETLMPGNWKADVVPFLDTKSREKKYKAIIDLVTTIWSGLFKDRKYSSFPDYVFILEDSNLRERNPTYGMYITSTERPEGMHEPYAYVAYTRNGHLVRVENRHDHGKDARIQITPISPDNIATVAPSLCGDEGALIDRIVVSFWNARESLDDIHRYAKNGEGVFSLSAQARGDIPFAFRNPNDISNMRIA